MKLSPIVKALRERCPIFDGRVFGIGEFSAIKDSTPEAPVAFVLPLDEEIKSITTSHMIRAEIYERMAIIVVQDLEGHQGIENYDALHDIRAELWRAIVGWQSDSDATPFAPDGGEPIEMDRGQYRYQFDFSREIAMTTQDDGYQPVFDDFTQTNLRVDTVDPADPNVKSPGPDGRVEIGADIAIDPP